ncbi:unnamed protein product [Protopolystoma xenopodis]|uniref:Uncharacterized protein n=1 Tax=Protopolystoma xenopodis TaxID=117903 RepID=A0A3S5AJY8_9PLAT|nr:unnamed protein product [Protopolystoma xenopodis]
MPAGPPPHSLSPPPPPQSQPLTRPACSLSIYLFPLSRSHTLSVRPSNIPTYSPHLHLHLHLSLSLFLALCVFLSPLHLSWPEQICPSAALAIDIRSDQSSVAMTFCRWLIESEPRRTVGVGWRPFHPSRSPLGSIVLVTFESHLPTPPQVCLGPVEQTPRRPAWTNRPVHSAPSPTDWAPRVSSSLCLHLLAFATFSASSTYSAPPLCSSSHHLGRHQSLSRRYG